MYAYKYIIVSLKRNAHKNKVVYWLTNENVTTGWKELNPAISLERMVQYLLFQCFGNFREHNFHKKEESTVCVSMYT
jgi:hypothetical protein